MTGRPLAAKLFLEGFEVPFIGATVTHTVNQATIAYIDIVPLAVINTISARTMVHLFVKDFNNPRKGYPYVLAFEGEVFGLNFGKTPSSRTFSISCIDYTSYWDNVIHYFFNAQQSLGKGVENFAPIAQDIVSAKDSKLGSTAVTHSTSSYFINTIKKVLGKPTPDGRIGDFLDGFVQVIKEIAGVNEFYLNAQDRLRIRERIRLNSSQSLNKLLDDKQAIDWFTGIINRQSGFQTLRMVIQDLMSIIFHDFTTIPFPAIVNQPSLSPEESLIPKSTPSKTIGSFIFKPNMYMLPPPMCNVFYPDEYSSFSFGRNFFQEPTRLIYKPELPMYHGSGIALPHTWMPESFKYFMENKKKEGIPSELVGDDDLQVHHDPGKFGEKTENSTSDNLKKEQFFLTNEERMRGILMAQEKMVPASSQFRAALSDVGRRDLGTNVAKYLFYKKRFQGRTLSITSHTKMSAVPGFTTLIVDDSDSDQSVLAYCHSLTHRIYANQGGYTNVSLSYARTIAEQDHASGKSGEPPIPPWFSEELFGKFSDPPESKDKDINKEIKKRGKQFIVSENLSKFYAELLGKSGSKTINSFTKEKTVLGACRKLIKQYKAVRDQPDFSAVTSFIDKNTKRDYVNINTAFSFLKMYSKTKDFDQEFLRFYGARVAGKGTNDSYEIKRRRDTIKEYRRQLKTSRGFRG